MATYLAQRALEPDGPSYPTVPWFSRVPDAKVQPIVDYWAHRLTDTARMALSLDSFWPCQADYLAYVEQGSEAHDRFDRATPEQIERMVQSHPGAITVPIGPIEEHPPHAIRVWKDPADAQWILGLFWREWHLPSPFGDTYKIQARYHLLAERPSDGAVEEGKGHYQRLEEAELAAGVWAARLARDGWKYPPEKSWCAGSLQVRPPDIRMALCVLDQQGRVQLGDEDFMAQYPRKELWNAAYGEFGVNHGPGRGQEGLPEALWPNEKAERAAPE
ncbi:MAG TPA: hypothetical protein VJB16_03715 [archaeon]|nr:hypothetical protein [archaeon]